MRLLLDTHVLLWWLADNDRIGLQARQLIRDRGNDVLISVVSLWEIVVKVRVGKLEIEIGDVVNAVSRSGFTLLHITTPHLKALAGLPLHHRDPFDHLLMAQAIAEDSRFISEDRNICLYPVHWILCSDATSSPAAGAS